VSQRHNVVSRLEASSLPVVVAQPDERHVKRTVSALGWYDRHRAYNIWFKQRRRRLYCASP